MKKRKLIISGIIAVAIILLAYVICVLDSPLNIYKKFKIEGFAKNYIEKNYSSFKLDDISVSYDRALHCYMAECKTDGGNIALSYNTELFMEFDNYYNEKYTAKAIFYQGDMEKRLSDTLKARDLKFDSVAVYVDLDADDKKNIVFKDAEIENERIECYITCVRKNSDKVMDKYQYAEYARKVANCVYREIGDDARIDNLVIKYDYDETKIASISWSRRMEEMSISEIADEIKY